MRQSIIQIALLLALPSLATGGLFDSNEKQKPFVTLGAPPKEVRWATTGILVELEQEPEQLTVMRVSCGGYSRHFVYDPNDPWRPTVLRTYGTNLPLKPGEYELTLDVYIPRRDDRSAVQKKLASIKHAFRVFPISANDSSYDAEKDLAAALRGSKLRIRNAMDAYDAALRRARSGAEKNVALDQYMFNYISAQVDDFRKRVEEYADLASYYGSRGRDGDALAALEYANQIYESENGTTFDGPGFQAQPLRYHADKYTQTPVHFMRFSEFYVRQSDLASAIPWQEKEAQFHFDQARYAGHSAEDKKRCRSSGARAYRAIAHLCVLLEHDWDAYDKWMTKARQLRPE